MEPTRRGFVALLGALAGAPAIVRVASIMPVKVMPLDLDDGIALDAIAHPLGPGLFICSYCGHMRGGMCPTCWRNTMMEGVHGWRPSKNSLEKVEIELNERATRGLLNSISGVPESIARAARADRNLVGQDRYHLTQSRRLLNEHGDS